jgi:uncharacterized protein (TIGR02246 family)
MRKLLVALAMFAWLCSGAVAGPKEEAFQVLEEWTEAFTASDADAMMKLYAPDALFFGTGSQTLITTTEGIRKYFEFFKVDRPRTAVIGDFSTMVLSDTVVLFTGLDTLSWTRDGKANIAYGRWTFVVANRDSGWRVVHFHRSAKPN